MTPPKKNQPFAIDDAMGHQILRALDEFNVTADYRKKLDDLNFDFKEHCIKQEGIVERLTDSQEQTATTLKLIQLDVKDINARLLDDRAVRGIYGELMKDHEIKVLKRERDKLEENSKVFNIPTPRNGVVVPAENREKSDDTKDLYKKVTIIASGVVIGLVAVLTTLSKFGLL